MGFLGFILAFYGVISAIAFSNITWYSYFIVGSTVFLSSINHKSNNDLILKLVGNNKKEIFKIYMAYFIIGFLFELVGRFVLNLWRFPSFNLKEEIIHVYLIGYPFTFFYLGEFFKLVQKRLKSFNLSIILTTLINSLLIEITNTFAWEWTYIIPYVNFEIFNVNILVIISWVLLVIVPLTVKKILKN